MNRIARTLAALATAAALVGTVGVSSSPVTVLAGPGHSICC